MLCPESASRLSPHQLQRAICQKGLSDENLRLFGQALNGQRPGRAIEGRVDAKVNVNYLVYDLLARRQTLIVAHWQLPS